MWLVRGLSFTCKGLQSLQANKSEELAGAFGRSYEGTLKQYHNFVVKGIFTVRVSMNDILSETLCNYFLLWFNR
jgi:hypothetical protein